MKILVADDDTTNLSLLKQFLSMSGREVITATDGVDALAKFAEHEPQLVILDVMMPGKNGWEVLEEIRASSQVPIIMLTAADSPRDATRGLLQGADDYIGKPFDLGELEARIGALMRRAQGLPAGQVLQVGSITIDDNIKEVKRGTEPVKLSPKEYDLLKLLASQPNRVFSQREIIEKVWNDKPLTSSVDVMKYISLLRQKLEEDAQNPKLLITIRGFGYKLSI